MLIIIECRSSFKSYTLIACAHQCRNKPELIPALADFVGVEAEVIVAFDTIHQLTKAVAKVTVAQLAVIRKVVQVDLRPASLALPHAVRYNAL